MNKQGFKIHIILMHPEIPQNTGNISRLCFGLDAYLHIILPVGFSFSSRYAKRAGLDYWDKASIFIHNSLLEFYAKLDYGLVFSDAERLDSSSSFSESFSINKEDISSFALSSKAKVSYLEADFTLKKHIFLYFGSEVCGFKEDFYQSFKGEFLLIPMLNDCRCLNLSNSASIVSYEAFRQINLKELNAK